MSTLTRTVARGRRHAPDRLRLRLEHYSQSGLTTFMHRSAIQEGGSTVSREVYVEILRGFLPADPLADTRDKDDPVEIVIPVGPRDMSMLAMVVRCAAASVSNPVSRITIVTPEACTQLTRQALSDYELDVALNIVSDEQLVPEPVGHMVDRAAATARRSWLRQQLVKWNAVLNSDAAHCLIVDADTCLTRSRTWVRGGVQILTPVGENHWAYKKHIERAFGHALLPLPVSFVSHHQLVQGDILREMLGELGGIVDGQLTWLAAIDSNEVSAASEYDTYATWLLRRHPERVALSYWGNKELPRSMMLDRSRQDPDVYSVSSHWYREPSLPWIEPRDGPTES